MGKLTAELLVSGVFCLCALLLRCRHMFNAWNTFLSGFLPVFRRVFDAFSARDITELLLITLRVLCDYAC